MPCTLLAESLRSFLDLSRKDRSDSASRVNAVKISAEIERFEIL